MKLSAHRILAVLLILALSTDDLAARGGRGGRTRRARGGGVRGGRPSNQARPSVRPSANARPQTIRPGAGTSKGNVKSFLNLPTQAASVAGGAGGKLNGTQLNRQVDGRYRNAQDRPFTNHSAHAHAAGLHAAKHHHAHGHWWRHASAVAVTAWVANAWAQPASYSYGEDGNVLYEDETVYVDGQPYGTAEQYYEQAAAIAGNATGISEDAARNSEWLPLGVFSVSWEGSRESTMMLQLAVSKEGVLSGTLHNEMTGLSRPVQGTVDKKTQRAAWSPVDGKSGDLVMETGIYELTKDQCTALVHFSSKKTQTWVLTRLDELSTKKTVR